MEQGIPVSMLLKFYNKAMAFVYLATDEGKVMIQRENSNWRKNAEKKKLITEPLSCYRHMKLYVRY